MGLKFVESVRAATPGAPQVAEKIQALARARFDHDPPAAHAALYALGLEIMKVQAAADLFGRAAMRFRLKSVPKPVQFALTPNVSALDAQGNVHRVVPWEAILDLLERDPVFATSAEELQLAYAEQHAFGAVKALDATVSAKVRDALVESMHSGKAGARTHELVAQIGQWTQSYAQTVVRTNASTAYSAGEFREAKKLEAAGAIGGLRFQAVLDGDARKNHRAAHGLVARVSDPVWSMLSPPLGYNCRCSLQPVDELFTKVPERAQVPEGARADPGFGYRPDHTIYGG